MHPAALALSHKVWSALLAGLASQGFDAHLGRRLYSAVSSAGLVEVDAEGSGLRMMVGGNDIARFWQLTLGQIHQVVLGAGLVTQEELRDWNALMDSPEFRWLSSVMMSVRGC